MKTDSFLSHFLLAAIVSFGISFVVWKVLGVFHPTMFWIASFGAAFVGALAGWGAGRMLATTFLTTILVRGAVLFFAIGG